MPAAAAASHVTAGADVNPTTEAVCSSASQGQHGPPPSQPPIEVAARECE